LATSGTNGVAHFGLVDAGRQKCRLAAAMVLASW
jgi:hypothetical protein